MILLGENNGYQILVLCCPVVNYIPDTSFISKGCYEEGLEEKGVRTSISRDMGSAATANHSRSQQILIPHTVVSCQKHINQPKNVIDLGDLDFDLGLSRSLE